MKQFETFEELKSWLNENSLYSFESMEDFLNYDMEKETEYQAAKLIEEGYDLDNLVADGHGYDFAGHKNNGWLWEDEVDFDYIKETGIKIEIRKRR